MDILGVTAALRNHILEKPDFEATTEQAHHLWNAWPDALQPNYLTLQALEILEREGLLQRNVKSNALAWKITKSKSN